MRNLSERLCPGDKVIIADAYANQEHLTEGGMVMIFANKVYVVDAVKDYEVTYFSIKIVGIVAWWSKKAWIKQTFGFSLEELE